MDDAERTRHPNRSEQSFQGFIEEQEEVEDIAVMREQRDEDPQSDDGAVDSICVGSSESAATFQSGETSSSPVSRVYGDGVHSGDDGFDELLEWLMRPEDTGKGEDEIIVIRERDGQEHSQCGIVQRTDHKYDGGESIVVADEDHKLVHVDRAMAKRMKRGDFVVVKSTGDLAQIVDPQKRKLAWCHSLQSEWVEDIDWPLESQGRFMVTNHIQVWPDLSTTLTKASKDDPRLPIEGPWLDRTMRTNGASANQEGFVLRKLPVDHVDPLWIEEEKRHGETKAKRRRCR
jgi:co-chaperonin GroES (HSP10)